MSDTLLYALVDAIGMPLYERDHVLVGSARVAVADTPISFTFETIAGAVRPNVEALVLLKVKGKLYALASSQEIDNVVTVTIAFIDADKLGVVPTKEFLAGVTSIAAARDRIFPGMVSEFRYCDITSKWIGV